MGDDYMAKIFIGVGHGGNDPGACANGLREADLNLQQALQVKYELERHGVSVVLSRYRDENDDLAEEIREAKASGADYAIDMHTNAGGGDGFEFIYSIFQGQTGGRDLRLGQLIEAQVKAIGQNSRGGKQRKDASTGRDYFGFIRELPMPSIITEMAFIDNLNDIKDWNEPHELKKYGTAVAKGILAMLGIAYKEPQVSNPTPTGTFLRVIAGSFTDRKNAEARQRKLKAAGFDSFLAAYTINGVSYLRVVVGSFQDREHANSMVNKLKSKGFSSFLDAYKK